MLKSFVATAVLLTSTPVPLLAEDPPQGADQKQDQKKIEPLDFRKLKEFLPAKVGEIARSEAKGQKFSVGEGKISQAEGDYHADGNDATAQVVIFDYGAMPDMVAGMTSWTKMEIDNESDDEYTKTVTYGTYRGLETYNTKEKHGTLQLLVGDRFLVSVTLNGIDPAEFGKTIEAMKLADLVAVAKA